VKLQQNHAQTRYLQAEQNPNKEEYF